MIIKRRKNPVKGLVKSKANPLNVELKGKPYIKMKSGVKMNQIT